MKVKSIKINSKSLLNFIFYFSIIQFFFIDFFNIPGVIIYFGDIALILALILSVVTGKTPNINAKKICLFIIFYAFLSLFFYMFNYENVLYYIWGFRNTFRVFIFWILCVSNWDVSDIENKFKCLDVLFYINAFFMIVQFTVFHLNQDYLGGIFGFNQGVNGLTNVFFVIIISKSLIEFILKKEGMYSVIVKCLLALGLAGIAEIKVFYFEFALIVLFVFVFTKFSFRKLFMVIVSCIGIALGINIISKMFDMAYFFDINFIIHDTLHGSYSGVGDISRGAFIPVILENFLKTKVQSFIGLGLGNCDVGNIICGDTPFYRVNGDLHYSWFCSMITFLEQGWFGLLFYMLFFVLYIFSLEKMKKKYTKSRSIILICQLLALISIALFFYNQTLRQEIAYMLFGVLAFPFVCEKSNGNNE